MKIITLNEDKKANVVCGICKKVVNPIKLINPRAVSEWDKKNGYLRTHSFNCCGKSWLMNYMDKPEDQGSEIY